MNEIKEKYKFLKPYLCGDLKRLGRNQDGGYVVSFNSALNSNYLIIKTLLPNMLLKKDKFKIYNSLLKLKKRNILYSVLFFI